MARILIGLILTLALAAVAVAEPPKEPAKPDNPPADEPAIPVKKLTVKATPAPPRALKYRLLPDPLDVTPGNAGPVWLRAGQAGAQVQRKYSEKEDNWRGGPLKDLPRKEVQALLDEYRECLRLADQAARRDHCDWELPPLTFHNLGDLPLPEIQAHRQMAALLSLRCRLELAEGRFDKAVYTLQTGLAMARDVGNGPTLIHNLVGIALAMIMLDRLEEVAGTPDAPNFYWALTELPRPFVEVRKTLEYELNSVRRSFPLLRELEKGTLSPDQAKAVVEELLETLAKLDTREALPKGKEGAAAMIVKAHPDAKQLLIARGRSREEVEKMPAAQAVGLAYLARHEEFKDEILKWFSVPPWQGQSRLEQLDKRRKADAERREGSVIDVVGSPVALKVHFAWTRLERGIDSLRCVEAVRLYAAAHDGKLPAALGDITEVPLPIDPQTGKGFDAYYKAEGDAAALEVPPPPGMPRLLGRRYEFTRAR
jgi:hypothetical protein